MPKMTLAVLFGGNSSEYEVSLQSAHAVLCHIDTALYDVIPLGITRTGEWYWFTGDIAKVKDNTWYSPADCVSVMIAPSPQVHGMVILDGEMNSVRLDAALPVLHGKNGEDGTVQGLLQLAGIPIIGCNTLASALCMDKHRAHQAAKAAGILVPRAFTVRRDAPVEEALMRAEAFGFPLFVKPVKAGSSFGITKVNSRLSLPNALALAWQHDDTAIVEEAIPGFEVGCAVMGDGELVVGEVDEIELSNGFFDYFEKYNLSTSSIHVPARISSKQAQAVKETAKVLYQALGCSGFARVDMFLTPAGDIVFNEVNTIPGFTPHSRFPSMMKAAGMGFEQVLKHILKGVVSA